MEKAKKRHRPRLSDWGRDGFATWRAREIDALFDVACDIACVDSLTPQEFAKYEASKTPVLVRNTPVPSWTLESLPNVRLKVGEDDDGTSVKLHMRDFVEYAKTNDDDSPLYVFDASDRVTGWTPPAFVTEDLFELVGEKRRPPYKWFLVGPKRSGTCVHVDPLGTAAWNTVVQGHKRWVLFEPGTSKRVVKGSRLYDCDDEPVNYFVDILPKIRAAYPSARRIEFVQGPGDTVFIPAGWWHAVLNLDDTIGVTQNFVSRANFDDAWRKVRTQRKRMAAKWRDQLHIAYPDLAAKTAQDPRRS